jgi:hypothetical protein
MRLSILTLCVALNTSFAAQPEAVPTQTVPAAVAEAGKDVVHQLNNAFAKVFETVAPSVVIIEVSKKNDVAESSPLDDLFFQGSRMRIIHGETPARHDRSKAKAPALSFDRMVTFSRIFTWLKAQTKST